MASFHDSFVYKNISSKDKGLVIASFESIAKETNSFLGMNNITGERYDGTMRYDYGAKYKEVASIVISMIRPDGGNFSVDQFRDVARWLTGAKLSSWLDLYVVNDNDEQILTYSFLCKCVDLRQYQLDGRTVGVTVTFESVAPWAYSPVQTSTLTVNGSKIAVINNYTDEQYSYIYPDITFVNSGSNGTLSITNEATGETTTVNNLNNNETVSMKSHQIIYSSVQYKQYGDDFNFVWLRLVPHTNNLTISGNGTLTISYRYPMKVGDCVIDISRNITCLDYDCEPTTDLDVAEAFNDAYSTVFGGGA